MSKLSITAFEPSAADLAHAWQGRPRPLATSALRARYAPRPGTPRALTGGLIAAALALALTGAIGTAVLMPHVSAALTAGEAVPANWQELSPGLFGGWIVEETFRLAGRGCDGANGRILYADSEDSFPRCDAIEAIR